ncbi:hypothetical protein CW736_03645 [Nonlabens sp. MB-3u-79]|uniref:DUF4230 domain-containing protein n=1 Tax=Nonlabens sp. MB-3u-79 TaxID=2058134 RepID=UPI000C3053B2|nr:DUF4230 domain-containing protein [Nonlabens sp. MB-3u-79]AUC78547.1 hypothetical protein CW736_03645 [Nonlabens sp. MB-3u-79]
MDVLFFLKQVLGAIASFLIFKLLFKGGKKEKTREQSVVLMEKIRRVCKFITMERDFSEVSHYQNVKDKIANFLLGIKKAVILIKAQARIGLDLTKIEMESTPEKKTIRLKNFSRPLILSIDTDFSYYDKLEGWANKFTSEGLAEVTRNAKQHIIDKVTESSLMDQAKKEAVLAIKMMEGLAAAIEWTPAYNELVLEEALQTKKLDS